jgi:thioredoxin-like negative regulator of GroEL
VRVVQWAGKDVSGADVKVPDATRPMVLVFLGSEREQNEELLKQVKVAVPEEWKARVAVFVSGAQARQAAQELVKTGKVVWPVVADEKGAAAEGMGVHGWPATVVVRVDGAEVARVGGAPESLAFRMGAYLELAEGKAGKPSSRPVIIGDGKAKSPAGDLKVAEELMAKGQAEQARKVLEEALGRSPNAVQLRVGLIKAMAQLRRSEALGMLDKLPKDALGADEMEVLRGRVLMGISRWSDAKTVLLGVVGRRPEMVEAHYLLGQVYEHEKDWEKAAREYRVR